MTPNPLPAPPVLATAPPPIHSLPSRPTPPKSNSSASGCTARAVTRSAPTGAISPPSGLIGKPIRLAYLGDLQRYADALEGSPASCARRLLVVKSLLSFASRMGFTPFNIGAAIRPPRPDDRLAERILDERQIFALLDAVDQHPRDHALIRLLYNGGLRVSEAVSLQWRNLVDGIVNIRGKGGRTRVVRLSRGTWAELQALRPADALGDDRVFPMTAWNAWDRVRRAARTAGLEALVSPHFLRHSHGTHALRRGADLATVRETLGHASLSTTGRYLHARPEKSSGDYLAV